MRDVLGHDWDKMMDQCRLCGMTEAIALDYKASDIGMSCADYKEEQEADDANDPKDAYPCFCGRESCTEELKQRASAKEPHLAGVLRDCGDGNAQYVSFHGADSSIYDVSEMD